MLFSCSALRNFTPETATRFYDVARRPDIGSCLASVHYLSGMLRFMACIFQGYQELGAVYHRRAITLAIVSSALLVINGGPTAIGLAHDTTMASPGDNSTPEL